MNVTIERQGTAAVVKPAGRLDFGAAAPFQQDMERALAGEGSKPTGVVIDCSALEYVSSAGLRVFLVGVKAAKAAGIGFAVCALVPAVREVFEVSGFDRIITVVSALPDALAKVGAAG